MAGLRHFDSLFGDYLTSVLLETKWVLPPELRKLDVRSSGYFPDPDLMGQGAMRNPDIRKKVPEPLQSKLRAISGVTNARVVIIPAGVVFSRDSTGHARARAYPWCWWTRASGDIKYRTITTGKGVSADAALRAGVRHHGAAGVAPRMTMHQATLIQGDGIGPEITAETVKVLAAAGVPVRLGGRAGRGRGGGCDRHAAARRHDREHPPHPPRAQGPAHHAGRHRLPLGERGAAQGIRALRQHPSGEDDHPRRAASRTWTS